MKIRCSLLLAFCLILLNLASADSRSDPDQYKWLCATTDPAASSVTWIVVSLADQRLYVYNGTKLIAWSCISSGCTGRETPAGSFMVSEKDPDHHSNLYENASMPWFMRLTDDGVGMHAGYLPGHPASHGCIRLPFDFVKELYLHVDTGTPVEITSAAVLGSGDLPKALATD